MCNTEIIHLWCKTVGLGKADYIIHRPVNQSKSIEIELNRILILGPDNNEDDDDIFNDENNDNQNDKSNK